MKKIFKNFLKAIIVFVLLLGILYGIILILTYYQYNFSPEFSDKKPVEIENNF